MSHAAIQRTHILKQQNSTSIYKYKHTYNKIKKKRGLDTHQIHDKVATGERGK